MSTALDRFVGELQRLREQAGTPSMTRMVALTAALECPLARSTISDKLTAKSLPDWHFVVSFVQACEAHSDAVGVRLPTGRTDLTCWDLRHRQMLRDIDEGAGQARLAVRARAELRRHPGAEPTTGVPDAAVPVVPRQLPAAVRTFTGRRTELALLAELTRQAPGATAPAILVIDGMAGIGKTALAVQGGHLVAEQFPDGQLYLDLGGFGPDPAPMPAADALRRCLDALGVGAERLPADLPALAALYRSLLAARRMLVLLDNARDSAQIWPLLPGGAGCLVLVTSRAKLTGLMARDAAHALTLDLPDDAEAGELLARRVGAGRVAQAPQAARDVIARCGRLPLALSIVAARAAYPAYPLSVLADELHQGAVVLDEFAGGEPAATDVRSAFSWSVRLLSTPACRMFRLLGGQLGPDIGAWAAASLAGVPVCQARQLLAELSRANLVRQTGPGRYSQHDLLRAYAVELGADPTEAGEQSGTTRRLLDHYTRTAHAAARLLDSHREPVTVAAPQPGIAPEPLAGYPGALAWLTAEQSVLLAAVRLAGRSGFDTHAVQLAWSIATFLDRQGRWLELAEVQRIALDAAQRLDRPVELAHAHRGLGRALVMLGQHEQARRHLGVAVERFRSRHDEVGVACVRVDLSALAHLRGDHLGGLRHAGRALQLYRMCGHPTGRARALSVVGRFQGELGALDRAVECCARAVQLQRESGDRRGEAMAWDDLGTVRVRQGDPRAALRCHQRAVELFGGLGDRHFEAAALARAGAVGRRTACQYGHSSRGSQQIPAARHWPDRGDRLLP